MMNNTTLNNAAEQLEITLEELNKLMANCQICAENEMLSAKQIMTLQEAKEREALERAERERRAERFLENLVNRYVLIIDTCSLLQPGSGTLLNRLKPILYRQGKTLNVPSAVMQELKKLRDTKPEVAGQIEDAIRWITSMQAEGLVRIFGANEDFADPQIIRQAIALHLRADVMIITQDNNLSMDLLDHNKMRSINGKNIAVYRVHNSGGLVCFHPDLVKKGAQPVAEQSVRSARQPSAARGLQVVSSQTAATRRTTWRILSDSIFEIMVSWLEKLAGALMQKPMVLCRVQEAPVR